MFHFLNIQFFAITISAIIDIFAYVCISIEQSKIVRSNIAAVQFLNFNINFMF